MNQPTLQVGDRYVPLSELDTEQTMELLNIILKKMDYAMANPNPMYAQNLQAMIDQCDLHLGELSLIQAKSEMDKANAPVQDEKKKVRNTKPKKFSSMKRG